MKIKSPFFLITFAFYFLQFSCNRGKGCEIQYDNSKSLGTIYLEPESANWLKKSNKHDLFYFEICLRLE